jgi:hypothetical protein
MGRKKIKKVLEEKRESDEDEEEKKQNAKEYRKLLRERCKDYYNRTKLTRKKPEELTKYNFKYEIGKFKIEL